MFYSVCAEKLQKAYSYRWNMFRFYFLTFECTAEDRIEWAERGSVGGRKQMVGA